MKSKKLVPASKKLAAKAAGSSALLADLRQMIVQARTAVARAVDTGLVLHYWQIGQRIRKDVLQEKRAEYGEKILQSLTAQLGWTHFVVKGQMEFYLAWLNKHERQDGEESPVGLILCAGKREETVELLDLGRSGIQVSAYLTKLLPKALLQRKLHEALVLARASLERRKGIE